MKVAAAAQRVGYDSEAAFRRAFKRATGLSPSVGGTRDWKDLNCAATAHGPHSESFDNLEDAVGNETVRLTVHPNRRFLAGASTKQKT